jgi:hypothetical protein
MTHEENLNPRPIIMSRNLGLRLTLTLSLILVASTQGVDASHPDRAYVDWDQKGFYLERAKYEEYVYSRGRKTELGDQVRVEAALRYQHDERSYARLRFQTDPFENRFDNKTSRFEIVGGHHYRNFAVRVDTEVNTNDNGGQSFGLDLDSQGTFISYQQERGLGVVFFPFNFDSQIGRQFNTWDVTRIYYIEDASSDLELDRNVRVANKTIPGIEFNFRPSGHRGWKGYAGFGLATYIYPTDPNFNIESQFDRFAGRWERKETYGYKFGLTYKAPSLRDPTMFNLQFAGHANTEETGALIAHAGTINGRSYFGDIFVDAELTVTRAGKAPWRVTRNSDSFSETEPFFPVYYDLRNQRQDWIGKTDSALGLRIGQLINDSFLPYTFFRYQGKHFIYRERQSAHLLRTADETESHGGLTRLGMGLYQQYGKFTVNPEFEWLIAQNPVFSNATDVREDRRLSSFRKQDFMLYLTVTYFYDGNLFRVY